MTYHTDVTGIDGVKAIRMSGADLWIGSSTNVWALDNANGHCQIFSITNYSVNNQLAVIDATSATAATNATNLCTLIKALVDMKILAEKHDGT